MSVNVTRHGESYRAYTTPPDGGAQPWESEPLPLAELIRQLLGRGCRQTDIAEALFEVDPIWFQRLNSAATLSAATEVNWEGLQAPAHLGAPFPGSGYDYGRMGTRGGGFALPFGLGLLLIAYGVIGHSATTAIVGAAIAAVSLVLLVYFIVRESRRGQPDPPGQVAEYLIRQRRGPRR